MKKHLLVLGGVIVVCTAMPAVAEAGQRELVWALGPAFSGGGTRNVDGPAAQQVCPALGYTEDSKPGKPQYNGNAWIDSSPGSTRGLQVGTFLPGGRPSMPLAVAVSVCRDVDPIPDE